MLELAERPDPDVPAGHVRVAVRLAGVNRADLLQRAGFYPAPVGAPPDIPGLEYVGVIDALGQGTRGWAVGDRVFGLVPGGAYAEKLVAHEREVVRVPEDLDDEQAAAIPEAFVTAWDALVVRGRAAPGDCVLVHAAGSGVGTAAIQIAHALGCSTIGTSRTADKLERAAAMNMQAGVVPQAGRFADEVKRAAGGRAPDVIIDLVGGSYVAEDVRAAAPRGRIVVVGLTAGASCDIDLRLVLQKRLEIVGTVLRSRPLEEKIEAAAMLERRICALIARGAARAVIDSVLPLDQAPAAHERMASNETFGKVLLRVAR